MRRAGCVLVLVSLAAADGCKRATLVGGPGAGIGGWDGGIVILASDGGVAADGDAPGVGDAGVVDGGADAPATDALHWLPPDSLTHCPMVPSVAACPADRPVWLGACPLAGLTCDYGGRDILCRGRWVCMDDLTWQPSKAECAGIAATNCPDQTPAYGSACDVDVDCSYPAHTTCSCTRATKWWNCQSPADPPADCPDELPLYGAPCGRSGLFCRYNSCNGWIAVCCSGTWAPMLAAQCAE